MSHVCVTSQFDRDKARVIDKADLSRKGSVDAPIRSLVDCINSCKDFYTTSSCSGRAIVFCEVCNCTVDPLNNGYVGESSFWREAVLRSFSTVVRSIIWWFL